MRLEILIEWKVLFSAHQVITWCGAAWDEITLENLNKGCKKCYMDPADFDEDMAKYDGVQDFSEIKFDPK